MGTRCRDVGVAHASLPALCRVPAELVMGMGKIAVGFPVMVLGPAYAQVKILLSVLALAKCSADSCCPVGRASLCSPTVENNQLLFASSDPGCVRVRVRRGHAAGCHRLCCTGYGEV